MRSGEARHLCGRERGTLHRPPSRADYNFCVLNPLQRACTPTLSREHARGTWKKCVAGHMGMRGYNNLRLAPFAPSLGPRATLAAPTHL